MLNGSPLVGFFGAIPGGMSGVKSTLKIMVNVSRSFLKPPVGDATKAADLLSVRLAAQRLVQSCPSKDYVCEATKLHAFVCYQVRYTRDMENAETIQYPNVTLAERSGDCDDKAILFACLANCVGFPARFCAVGVSGESFSHVSAQVMIPGEGWVNAETIPIDDDGTYVPLGWFPPDATCLMLAHI